MYYDNRSLSGDRVAIATVEHEIATLQEAIKAVGKEIANAVTKVLDQSNNEEMKTFWMKEKDRLCDKERTLLEEKRTLLEEKRQLREKESKLREKESKLLEQKHRPRDKDIPRPILVTDVTWKDMETEDAYLPCSTAKTFVLVLHKDLCGLDFINNKLYVRREMASLWKDYLESSEKNLIIEGPPGVGKSCEIWQYCCVLGAQGKNVLWMSAKGKSSRCVVFSDRKIASAVVKADNLHEFVDSGPRWDLFVADGVGGKSNESSESALSAVEFLHPTKIVRFILVTSLSLQIKQDRSIKFTTAKLSIPGWRFEDYEDMCTKNRDFFEAVRLKLSDTLPGTGQDVKKASTQQELLQNKFYYAGARYVKEQNLSVCMACFSG